ncbi:MAG TPA: glycosyltransferase [Chitinophagales bacterium]|nr:glycosyltransferase [Chitinophagales bacterium]
MKKLRVGVWLHELFQPTEGGGYGYYQLLLKRINTYNFKDAEIVYLSTDKELARYNFKNKYHIQWVPYQEKPESRSTRLLNRLTGRKTDGAQAEKRRQAHELLLKQELNKQVDVIYYASPQVAILNFPFVSTVWDLGHLSMFAFPEVSMNHIFEGRKNFHDIYIPKSLMVFAESETGKNQLVKYMGLNEQRIKVVPLFPSELITDAVSSQRPPAIAEDDFFIHYPAQFWAHKNHFNLLVAFKQVLVSFPKLKLIFTGSDKGNKEYIQQVIAEMGLSRHVVDLGFVSMEELKWLYLHSQGLVMATFLGPTNMPLVEAAELGCPVACSTLGGHIEQIGDYGYYFDPKNPDDMAKQICSMLNDNALKIKRPYVSTFTVENALKAIDEAFSELRHIRFCWGEKDELSN